MCVCDGVCCPLRFLSSTVGGRISRMLLFGFGFHWIRVKGHPVPTQEAPIWVVSPHSSLLDSFIISMFGLPTYVAKQEVRNMPLFGCECVVSTTVGVGGCGCE